MILNLHGIFIGFTTSVVHEQFCNREAYFLSQSSRRCGSVFCAFALARMYTFFFVEIIIRYSSTKKMIAKKRNEFGTQLDLNRILCNG